MPFETTALVKDEFDYVRTLAKDNAAIVIDAEKQYLVESRLSPLAEREGFGSLRALIVALRKADELGRLHVKAIDALTTNETLFFRDRHPFDALSQTALPELIAARTFERRLNIWSAAASTGQEAYSIALLIRDRFPDLISWRVNIFGTDISETVLEQARAGIYSQHEVNRGLPAPLLIKYFQQDKERRWRIDPDLRSMVQFRTLNLIESWPNLPIFDFIFMRNVLIYFDTEAKRDILNRVARQLAPDGYLSLGSAETPMMITSAFRSVPIGRASFYQPVPCQI